ncbi:MAG: DUF2946 family protein [Alphaproteobacteria bacterium]|nr:DUF2946 family protein [Alphaproteobacteria bacterium]
MLKLRLLQKFIHLLLILAFVSAGASPSCKFISGENQSLLMEICKANGQIETLEFAMDGQSQKKPDRSDHKEHADNDCAFCFASAHLKLNALPKTKTLSSGLESQTGLLITSAVIARQSARHFYAPRGPPTLS